MRVAWLSFLDPPVLSGGGELSQRAAILEGRPLGHTITVTSFLGSRHQRALRRARLLRRVDVDWDADLFVMTDISNYQTFRSGCRGP